MAQWFITDWHLKKILNQISQSIHLQNNTPFLFQKKVRKPIQQRKPIGYNLEFLTSYKPNNTFYLPEDLRNKLKLLGNFHNGDRPAGTYAKQIFNRLPDPNGRVYSYSIFIIGQICILLDYISPKQVQLNASI